MATDRNRGGGRPTGVRRARVVWPPAAAMALMAGVLVLGCERHESHGPPPEETILRNRLAKDPNDVDAHLDLANLYYDTDRPHRAIPHYRGVLKHRPKDANVRTDLGTCYKRVGDLDRAAREYEHVLRDHPRHVQAAFNLGVVSEMAGDLARAAEMWERAADLAPGTPLAHRSRQFAADARRRMADAGTPTTQRKETNSP